MAKRRGNGSEDEGGSWMDTYGDMITLVLTFFVLLYSMSSMDKSKWQYLAEAFSGKTVESTEIQVVGTENPENDPTAVYVDPVDIDSEDIVDFDDFYKYLSEFVESNGLSDSVSVEMSNTGVYMRFRDNVFFAGDSDVLLDEGKYILEVISDGIRAVNERVRAIKVSGHTASSSTSDVNEWELSSGRANSVINHMSALDACEAGKFSSAGYGKNRPIADNDTEEGRRQNRRVEIVFIRNDIDFTNPEVMNELLQLEFGSDFVDYSNEDGSDVESTTDEISETTVETDTNMNNPDRNYVSKNEGIAAIQDGNS